MIFSTWIRDMVLLKQRHRNKTLSDFYISTYLRLLCKYLLKWKYANCKKLVFSLTKIYGLNISKVLLELGCGDNNGSKIIHCAQFEKCLQKENERTSRHCELHQFWEKRDLTILVRSLQYGKVTIFLNIIIWNIVI